MIVLGAGGESFVHTFVFLSDKRCPFLETNKQKT